MSRASRFYIPGGAENTTQKLIRYASVLGKSCICNTNDDNKVKKDATNTNGLNISNAQRTANILSTSQSYGGRIQFGTEYLGQKQIVNYLGRVEGQPGGYGQPPRNKFIV
jgi:hypothetical protein